MERERGRASPSIATERTHNQSRSLKPVAHTQTCSLHTEPHVKQIHAPTFSHKSLLSTEQKQ
eukprot:scaffold10061_cov132-Skeletonema_marinoi.AAC.1